MPDTTYFGFLNINKPAGMTSHDVVSKVRRILGIKKVGHAGTLDPLATGILVICVGSATRLSEYVMHTRKGYRAEVRLGITTTTYDAEGDIIAQQDSSHITHEQIEAALADYTGTIDQMPPMYSAIKQGGKKLYELAREGKTVERKTRQVEIHNLQLIEWTPPRFTVDVECSSGTYIRSLAFDIGEALGVGAHLSRLTRTTSGRFSLANTITLEQLADSSSPEEYLIPPAQAISGYPTITLTAEQVDNAAHGRTVDGTNHADETIAFAYDEHGNFIAILRAQRGKWRPHKVFWSR